jgi:threonine synthase
VSDVQEAQMASMGDNVLAVAVDGTFDDCQRLVKTAFADDELRAHVWLTPANSINLGRLLPQVFYYFLVSAVGGERGPLVAVPSGNFGDLTAGLIAKRLGLHVRHFVAATNVNDAVPRYLESGLYDPKESIRTVANAMDVGAPSNFERMQWIYGGDLAALRRDVTGFAYEDARVVAEIGRVYRQHGYMLDPHGAIGWLAINDALKSADPADVGVFLATAHPAKFREVVEPAIGQAVPLPPALAEAITRPRYSVKLSSDYADLRALLRS